MSSPVVNKDTLYYYTGQDREEHFLGFLHEDRHSGWSMNLKSGYSWEWAQTKEYRGNPIGQRCILQW